MTKDAALLFHPPINSSVKGQKKRQILTNLYDARPSWLELAYKKLDEAIFAAYGWPSDLSDEEILRSYWP